MTSPTQKPFVIPSAVRSSALMLALLGLAAGMAGCGAPGEHAGGMTASSDAGSAGDSPTEPDGAGDAGINAPGHVRCVAPPGVSDSPQNTDEAVQLLNALPKPTTVACFLESLARPLGAFATKSQVSAQPALSARSPRVFVKLGPLWVSVVIDGASSYLMEFGELVGGDPPQSVKGELLLPLAEAVAPSAPYDRVAEDATGTVCRACHTREQRAESDPFCQCLFVRCLPTSPEQPSQHRFAARSRADLRCATRATPL